MKRCASCIREKPLREFRKYKSGVNKGRRHSYCKICSKKQSAEHRKTHPWGKAYAGICSRCKLKSNDSYKRYKNREVSITIADLKFLWFRDKAYLMKKPSIHRKDNNKGYSLDNCEYIELRENVRLAMLGRKSTPLQRETSRQNMANLHKKRREKQNEPR